MRPSPNLTEHEPGRLSLSQGYLGPDPVRIALKGDRGGKTQAQVRRVKHRSFGAEYGFVCIPGVVKGRPAFDVELHGAANDVNATYQTVTISFGTLADGHVIGNFPHPIGGQEACDQHIGTGPIELFVDNLIADRGYLEIPTLLVVENGGKHTGGIETRKTEPIDRAVQPHQCSGTHVADDSVVFYRLIRHESSLLCCDVSSRRHSVDGSVPDMAVRGCKLL